jgi:hypothetical protein
LCGVIFGKTVLDTVGLENRKLMIFFHKNLCGNTRSCVETRNASVEWKQNKTSPAFPFESRL